MAGAMSAKPDMNGDQGGGYVKLEQESVELEQQSQVVKSGYGCREATLQKQSQCCQGNFNSCTQGRGIAWLMQQDQGSSDQTQCISVSACVNARFPPTPAPPGPSGGNPAPA